MGVHTGPVVFRDGDYYGRTVIVASRVTDRIGPSEVVLTEEAVAEVTLARPGVRTARRGEPERGGRAGAPLPRADVALVAARQASRSFTLEPVRSTAPEYTRPASGISRAVEPIESTSAATTSSAVAEPSEIRTGIASADENGTIDAMRDSVEFGSLVAPSEMKNDARISRLSGTIDVLQLLHPRDQRTRNREQRRVEREPQHEPPDRERAPFRARVPGSRWRPVTRREHDAVRRDHASWSNPSAPIPRILPASSCRARIVDSRISTTRDAFSSITPVATQTP